MIRKIIPGRQQRVQWCPLVTVAGILISSITVPAALMLAEVGRLGWVGPLTDSRPRLEGARYKYLTSCSRLLSPSSPFSHAHTRTHH